MKKVAIYLMYLFLVTAFTLGIMVSTAQFAFPAHDTTNYILPHEVANWFVENGIYRINNRAIRYRHLGCDDVITYPIVDAKEEGERTIGGFMMVADGTDGYIRLIVVEAFNFERQQIFSWKNEADYEALKSCHQRPEGSIAL